MIVRLKLAHADRDGGGGTGEPFRNLSLPKVLTDTPRQFARLGGSISYPAQAGHLREGRLQGDNMKKISLALLTVAVAASVATPTLAQRSARSHPTYEQCYQLGLARGFIVSVGDWRNFEWFIKQCMAGKIPF